MKQLGPPKREWDDFSGQSDAVVCHCPCGMGIGDDGYHPFMVIYCGWVYYWVYHIIRILPTGPFLVLVKGVLSSDRFCGQVAMKRRCFAWIGKQFAGDVMLRKDQKKWPAQSQECKNTGQFFRMMSCTFFVDLSGLGQSLGGV